MKLLALIAALALHQPPPQDPGGYWLGTLNIRARELRLLIHVTSTSPPAATFTSIDQDNQARPVTGLTIANGAIEFTTGNATIRGRLAADGRTIAATYSQSGAEYPVTFARVDGPPVVRRPQEPVAPFPYVSEEVTVRSTDDVVLAGTFTRPSSAGPHPAVLLISGSGPQDRDESVFGHKPFLVLGDYLARRGFAVLRLDDRGAGKSTGARTHATIEDYATDAVAAVTWLAARADVDRRRIGLIGHSEGGIVAPLALARTRDVAFLVLIAAPAMNGTSLAMLQADRIARAAGAAPQQVALQQALNGRIYALLEKGGDEAAIRASVRAILKEELAKAGIPEAAVPLVEKQMEPQIQRGLTPWFRHFLAHDPNESLRAVRVPVLALYGSVDVQVPADENASRMRDAITASSPQSEVRTLTGLNHLLQNARTGAMNEYPRIEETMAPVALEAIAEWLRRVARVEPRPK